MSSYLLLRNNKESGPFSIEEIKGMSLKAYDLIWVVGKSAAWRYPGEINELKSFAPPVPDLNAELKKSRTDNSEIAGNRKQDPANPRSRESSSQRLGSSRSVYVNLPAEKKGIILGPPPVIQEAVPAFADIPEPSYDFSDLYNKKPGRAVRFSGKLLWFGTILLLFGTGILTGLFISDRRKFFSTGANHPQSEETGQPPAINIKKEISPVVVPAAQKPQAGENAFTKMDSAIQTAAQVPKKPLTVAGKKNLKNVSKNKDSLTERTISSSVIPLNESLKQNTISDTDILYQKIKSHPENYVNLHTGRFSTGVFGGISSFPVTVTNSSPVKMDLVVVTIDYIQNNEKVFKTESLSYNDLEPGETVTIRAPKSPRGIKINTRIRVVHSRQLDLSYSN